MASRTTGLEFKLEMSTAFEQQQPPLEMKLLVDRYSVLRLDPNYTPITMLTKIVSCTRTFNFRVVSASTSLVNLSITPGEISVVLPTMAIPQDDENFNPQAVENAWLAFRVEPPIAGQGIDFGVVGIMARISGVLARAEVSLFAVSTFDTDYILVKEDRVAVAVKALRDNSCSVLLEEPQNMLWTQLGLCLSDTADPPSSIL